MFRILFIALAFQFLLFNVSGQTPQSSIDSLNQALSQTSFPFEKFSITKKLISLYADVDLEKTISLCDSLVVLSDDMGVSLDAKFYDTVGLYCRQIGDYHKSKTYLQKAVVLYHKENNVKKVAECLSWLGYVLYVLEDYEAGMEICYCNLELIRETGYKEFLALTYIDLGFLMRSVNHNESMGYFLLAGKTAAELKDTNYLFAAYNEIGNSFYTLENYQQALKFQKKSLDLKLTNKGKYSGSLGYSYNDLATTYIALHEYDTAAYYLLQAVETNTDDWFLAYTYNNLGDCYFSMGNYLKAMECMNRALESSRKVDVKLNYNTIYKSMSSLYATQGKYEDAFKYLTLSVAYSDSVFSAESQQQINELMTVYKTKEKDKEIQLLNLDKEKQAEKDKKQMIIMISIIIGLFLVSWFAVFAYRQKVKIKKEKKRSDELLLNILPSETAEEIKLTGSAEPRQFDMVTVMFTDFKGFTGIAEKMSAKELVAELHFCFKNFDEIISRHQIEKIKTIGDSYMCAGGLPAPNKTNPADVINAAIKINEFMKNYKERRQKEEKPFFEVRIGIHTGIIVAGIVGVKKFSYDIWGDTVNIASRMESSGEAGKINISVTTYELIKDKFTCEYRGEVDAKGKGKIKMYFVEG
jgi:adenylate cyclase